MRLADHQMCFRISHKTNVEKNEPTHRLVSQLNHTPSTTALTKTPSSIKTENE